MVDAELERISLSDNVIKEVNIEPIHNTKLKLILGEFILWSSLVFLISYVYANVDIFRIIFADLPFLDKLSYLIAYILGLFLLLTCVRIGFLHKKINYKIIKIYFFVLLFVVLILLIGVGFSLRQLTLE